MSKNILQYCLLFCLSFISCFSQSISLDLGYGTNGYTDFVTMRNGTFGASAIFQDNKLIIGYTSTSPANIHLKKYNLNGSVDVSFGSNGEVFFDTGINTREDISKIIIQSDGKILIFGKYYSDPSTLLNFDVFICRLNADGTKDTSFGNNGFVFKSLGNQWDRAISATLDSNGNIYLSCIAGNNPFQTNYLLKYFSSGTVDSSFGTNGVLTIPLTGSDSISNIYIDENGILLGGVKKNTSSNFNEIYLERRNLDGLYDNSFGDSGIKTIGVPNYNIGIADLAHDNESDSIYILSNLISSSSSEGLALVKINNSNGTLINTFGNSGIKTYPFSTLSSPGFNKILLLPNHEILVGGVSRLEDGNNQLEVVMYKFSMDNGTMDFNFGTLGLYRPITSTIQESFLTGFFRLPNGEILLTANGTYASLPDRIYSSKHINAYTLSNENQSKNQSVTLYPNPASDKINLSFDENKFNFKSIYIYNNLGSIVLNQNNVYNSIDICNLASGIYFLEIVSLNNEKYMFKFIKN